MGRSNIDVTLATADIGGNVRSWRVVEVTDSDHRVLMYQLNVKKGKQRRKDEDVQFRTKLADWDAFSSTLASLVTGLSDHPDVSV